MDAGRVDAVLAPWPVRRPLVASYTRKDELGTTVQSEVMGPTRPHIRSRRRPLATDLRPGVGLVSHEVAPAPATHTLAGTRGWGSRYGRRSGYRPRILRWTCKEYTHQAARRSLDSQWS
jgi:hypothetical protein